MNKITVDVKAEYLAEQSKPEQKQHVYAYTIRIINDGDVAAQLISRRWLVTDENDKKQEVEGLGVVGQQPVIAPGESYSYSSGVVIETRNGTMAGSYCMKTLEGQEFDADIPMFALVQPNVLH